MQVYDVEDIILDELRRMAGFEQVDDVDVGLVHFKGTINVGRIAAAIWEIRHAMAKVSGHD